MQGRTIKELAEHVGGKVVGDDSIVVTGAATLDDAGAGQITFLSNEKYIDAVASTSASAVITNRELDSNASLIIADDPYYAFMQIVVLIHGHRKHPDSGMSERANIAESATIGDGCTVSHNVTICDGAVVGEGCYFYPGVFIGPDAKIGNDCIFYPNAVIFNETIVGDRVIVQSNASVGNDGFGFSTHNGVHHKIPQIGKVILEDDVEIGANAVIERATLGETIIGAGTKIGDLVEVGHGTKIGTGCLFVPQSGVAGSTTIGNYCVFGGQVAVNGHIKLGNMVRVGAKSGVLSSQPDGVTLLGVPAVEANTAKRIIASTFALPTMKKKLKKMERQIAKLEKAND